MVEKMKAFVMSKESERVVFGLVVLFGLMLFSLPAYAAGEPALFTNGKKLIDDALKWVLILVVPAAGVLMAWQGIKKMMADGEPGAVSAANKAMKNIILAGAIALSSAGLVKLLLGYFS